MENSKKLSFIFLFIFLVLNINFSSAWDGDNVYSYNPETKTATIENLWGLPLIGSDLAYVTLTSPDNKLVHRGVDVLVGEFDFTPTDDSMDSFGEIYLTDLKNGNSISRGQQFKYKKYKEVSVDDYETVCEDVITENGTTQECTRIEVGSHMETKVEWMPIINPNNEFIGGVTYEIGVFVDVEKGDYGDWIPSIMGVEIEEWSTWTENLNVDLISYYKFNETSGSIAIDSTDSNNGTIVGATINQTGIIGRAYSFDGTEDYLDITGISSTTESYSFQFWVKSSSTKSGTFLLDNQVGRIILTWLDSSSGGGMGFYDGSNWRSFDVSPPSTNEWTHIVFVLDSGSSEGRLYINSTRRGTTPGYTGTDLGDNIVIASDFIGGDHYWVGLMDEVGIWNRTLSQSEINDLYNGGSGITWKDVVAPEITILFPQNITYNNTLTEINYSVTSPSNRCWYSIDGGATNSSDVAAGINFTGLISTPLTNRWTVYCNNSLGVDSDNVQFFVNKSAQTELISPANNSNFTITLTNFSINSTPINTNLINITLFIWYENGTEFLTNTTILSGSSGVQTIFTENLTDGIFLWNAETCGEDISCLFADENRTLEIHTTPATVIIHFPEGTINYLVAGGNLTLNWTISEPGQNLSEHIVNCSYIYNSVETQLNLTQCIEINETTFLYVDGINNLTFKVREEFGLITTNITTWDFLFERYNVTFNNQTIEGSQETFTAEIILGGGASISQAIFYYNDTNYTTSIISSGGEYIVTSSITVPLIEANTNYSLGFYIVIDGITYNLETFVQLVISVNMSLCGVSNDTLINISLFNEETKIGILGDIEINAQAISKTSGEIIESFNTTFTNVSTGRICLVPTTAYSNLYFGAEIRYSSDNFVAEFYNIQMADMADYPINLSLFDLASNDSTEFLIRYKDDNLISIEGAIIQLQRKYISENIYEVVEAPITSDEGTVVVHIDLNTNKYRVTVVKDGEVLNLFENVVFDCENELSGECTKLLLGKLDPQNDVPLIDLTDFSYSISSTDEIITTTFVIPSGTPATVNVILTQTDQFGNETTCDQSVFSSAGSIDCTFEETIGDSFLGLVILKDQTLQAQQTYIVVEDTNLNFLGNNFFIVIIIMLSLVGMAFSSPEWMIINSVIVMLIGGALWLLNGVNFVMGLGSLVWLIISAGILIFKLSKQEDR